MSHKIYNPQFLSRNGCRVLTSAAAILVLWSLLPVWGTSSTATEILRCLDGSYMHLSGKTNLIGWDCHAPVTRGEVSIQVPYREIQTFLKKAQMNPENIGQDELDKLTVVARSRVKQGAITVPLNEFVFPSKGMERDMHETFRAKQNPLIQFLYRDLSGISIANTEGRLGLILHTEGILEMAGVQKPVQLDFQVSLGENDILHIAAVKNTYMTSFGMTPPEVLRGLIKADDLVEVRIDLRVGPVSWLP